MDILERIFYEKIYLPLRVNWTWPSAGQNREVKGDEGTTLSRLIGPVSGSFPSEVFEMNTYLSLE